MMRALATSQTFGSTTAPSPVCIARKASAFFVCSRFGIHGDWMRSPAAALHLFEELADAHQRPSHSPTANLLLVIASGHSQCVEASIERFKNCLGFDVCA